MKKQRSRDALLPALSANIADEIDQEALEMLVENHADVLEAATAGESELRNTRQRIRRELAIALRLQDIAEQRKFLTNAQAKQSPEKLEQLALMLSDKFKAADPGDIAENDFGFNRGDYQDLGATETDEAVRKLDIQAGYNLIASLVENYDTVSDAKKSKCPGLST